MFTPFWCKHDDSEACSNKEEFENHGFSDFILFFLLPILALMNSFAYIFLGLFSLVGRCNVVKIYLRVNV